MTNVYGKADALRPSGQRSARFVFTAALGALRDDPLPAGALNARSSLTASNEMPVFLFFIYFYLATVKTPR